ncbi:MAG: hypothetical protein ACFBZ8_09215 [Opitutales bacterium]
MGRNEALAHDPATGRVFFTRGDRLQQGRFTPTGTFESLTNIEMTAAGSGTRFSFMRSFAFADGVLYGHQPQVTSRNPDGGIYIIDTDTGVSTLFVPDTTLPIPNDGDVSALAADPETGLIYVSITNQPFSNSASTQTVYALDPQSGSLSLVVEVNVPADGLAFGNDRLYFTNGNGPINVYNTITGQLEDGLVPPRRNGNGPGGATFLPDFVFESVAAINEGPPATPTGLTFFTSSIIRLDWDSNLEPDFLEYAIFRSVDGVNFSQIATSAFSSFIDFEVVEGLNYQYFVTAIDRGGLESDASEILVVALGDAQPDPDPDPQPDPEPEPEPDPAPDPATLLSVDSIDPDVNTNNRGRDRARIVVFIVDGNGDRVEGATVTATLSGAFEQTVSATTNRRGRAVLRSQGRVDSPASFTVTIDSVEKSGFTYDPDANNETTDSF